MGISNWQFYGFFVLVLVLLTIDTQSSVSIQPSNVHLEPPRLSGNFRDNRPPFRASDINQNDIYSCGNSYLKTNGTTCGLKEIMIGRCYEYQYIKRNLYLSNTTTIKNCSELYELFEKAVRNKSYCNMNMSTYTTYFDHALDGIHVINRAMFWSGAYTIAHTYSGGGLNYITLEDTLAAGMANGLMWCGKENDSEGFDYLSCPSGCKDNIWADSAFWGLASQTFAERAAGEIYVILNGTRTDGLPAFRNTSYFGTFELVNFRRQGFYRVTKVNVLLLHTPDQNVVEKCGEKSLLTLQNIVRGYGFEYTCQDDPDELILIMCGDAWGARECQIAREVLRKEWDKKVYGKSAADHPSMALILFHFLLLGSLLFLSD